METGIYLMTTRGPRQETGLWCYLLEARRTGGSEETRKGYGKLYNTSENELMLMALWLALRRIKEQQAVTIYSGNRYLLSVLSHGWQIKWQQADWKGNRGREVAHAGYWKTITELMEYRPVVLEPDGDHKYSYWQKFQLGKLENVDFTKWEEGLDPPAPIFM